MRRDIASRAARPRQQVRLMTGHDVPATAVERWAGGRVDADHGVIVTPALASDHGLSHNDFVVSHALPGSMRFAIRILPLKPETQPR
jgi:hypothetical protein